MLDGAGHGCGRSVPEHIRSPQVRLCGSCSQFLERREFGAPGRAKNGRMPRLVRLPRTLGPHFSVHEAARVGVTSGRSRGRDLAAPFHGVRARPHADASADLGAQCHAYAPRLREGQFFSHETALALHGAPLPEYPYRPALHVSAYRPAREPRTHGVVGHRLQHRDPAYESRDGLPLEHPVRAWRQVGGYWSHDSLVAAAEYLIHPQHPLATFDDLVDEVTTMGDVRHGILRSALRDVRGGVESPRETRLRLLLVRAGLPEPMTGWTLRDEHGAFVARLDLAYRRWRVAPEYDGRQHAESTTQFRRDADRWNAIREEGWTVVRVLSHHLDGNGAQAVGMVRRALIAAGWTPGLGG